MNDLSSSDSHAWTVDTGLGAPPSTADNFGRIDKTQPKREAEKQVHPGSIPYAYAVTNLDFDVTENCNLGCLYCFKGEMYSRHMSLETMKKTFDWLLQASNTARSVNCNFMGGEPTMRWKQIREFVPWARRRARAVGKQATFSMTTNLTLFTEEMRQFIDDYGFGILMSIDGCPEVQDAQRPAKNGKQVSQVVEKWARSLLRTRPRSTARATIHPDYVHRFAEGYRYLHSIGFAEVAVSGAEYDDWKPEHFEELDRQFAEMLEYTLEVKRSGGEINLTGWKYYINKLVQYRATGRESEIEFMPSPCGAGKGYMMVDYTGDIWPCHRFDGADTDAGAGGQFRMGNIYKDGFNHDLQRVFLDFDHGKVHKDTCTTCPANPVCGGYCPAANLSDTHSIYSPHDTYCRWTWGMYEYAEKLYNRIAEEDGPEALEALLASVANTRGAGDK